MKAFRASDRLASRCRILGLAVASIALAVGLACAVSTVTFPMFAGVDGGDVTAAVIATALVVALPVILTLALLLARVSDQKLDLTAREELFVTAEQIGKFGYWYYDIAAETFSLSQNVHALLGDPDARLQMSLPKLLEMTNPEDRDKLSEALRRIVVEGTCEEIEYRITGLDGEEKTFWVDGKQLLDRSGKPVRAYGACQDITERKRIEAALRESEDHYRHAVELNPQIPWLADANGNALELGPVWCGYTGMDREDALGSGWAEAVHPDDKELTLRLWFDSVRTGNPLDTEFRLRHSEGNYRWFRARASARRNEAGVIIRWYGTLEDIYDRKMADAALRNSEAFSRSILDSTPDCVRVVDLDGNVQFMNSPGLKALEIDDFASLKGRFWADLWPAEARSSLLKAFGAACNGSAARFSGFCPTAKGTPKWWDVSVSPILGPDGAPDRLLAISRDMTAEKHAQDEVEKAWRAAERTAQKLDDVLSSTSDCVMTFDRQFRITYLNRRA